MKGRDGLDPLQRRKKMTTKNIVSFTFNQTIKNLSEFTKTLKEKLNERCCTVPPRRRDYDLKMVLVDWNIKCPLLRDAVTLLSQINEKQENMEDLHKACMYLRFCSKRNRRIKSDEMPEDFKEFLIYFEPQINPWDLVEDWELPYHQGRALEYISQSLFAYGRARGDILGKAEDLLDHYIKMLKKKQRERNKK